MLSSLVPDEKVEVVSRRSLHHQVTSTSSYDARLRGILTRKTLKPDYSTNQIAKMTLILKKTPNS